MSVQRPYIQVTEQMQNGLKSGHFYLSAYSEGRVLRVATRLDALIDLGSIRRGHTAVIHNPPEAHRLTPSNKTVVLFSHPPNGSARSNVIALARPTLV